MRSRRHRESAPAGFTLIEAMIVIAIAGILAAITIVSFARAKPRADMLGAAADLQGLLHQARETALATGNPVSVLVYKAYSPTTASGIGYFIAYQDACFDFYTGGATCGVTYGTYDPAHPAVGGSGALTSVLLDTMTLPSDVMVGPAGGLGTTLMAPLAGIVVNVDCSFCGTTGGAVQFDPRGQATFYSLSGTTQAAVAVNGGASLSLTYISTITSATGQVTLVILSTSGAVQVFGAG